MAAAGYSGTPLPQKLAIKLHKATEGRRGA